MLVTLGNFATRFVLRTKVGITGLRGTVQRAGRFTVLPIFHPAAAIYDRTKHDTLVGDFELLRRDPRRTAGYAMQMTDASSHQGRRAPTQDQLF